MTKSKGAPGTPQPRAIGNDVLLSFPFGPFIHKTSNVNAPETRDPALESDILAAVENLQRDHGRTGHDTGAFLRR